MGGSSYSDDLYRDRAATRAKTNTPVFHYTASIASGAVAAKVNPKLDPKNVKVRESRDSAAHPESLAIGVFFDVTGSMKHIPELLQKKLPALMNLLIQKGYVAHPQIMFGAIGDANNDGGPLQVGQFESGLEMEDDLGLFWLEGAGGGGHRETYELAHYFFLKHTSIDCFEKRSEKGFLFTIGDEAFYEKIKRTNVKDVIGDDLPENLDTADVIKELSERWNVFHIHAQEGSYRDDPRVLKPWKALLGQNVLLMENAENVAELIATTIGVVQGTDIDDVRSHLKDIGTDDLSVGHVMNALVPLAHATAMTKAGTVGGELPVLAGGDTPPGVERL